MKKMKILVIVLIIIIISLSAFWQTKKLVDLHVYNSILTENPFYFEKQNEWFQYNLDEKHRKVSFPSKFQAITALNYDNEVIWIGTTEKSEDSIFLAEYNPKYNDCTVLCSENDLKAQGLELSTITEFHFQPKTKNLSFLSGNDLYLYNRKEKRFDKIKSNITETIIVFGMSVTWIDEETIVYINVNDDSDFNLYEYNYVDKKENCTDIWAGSINGISPDNKTIYYLTGDKDSFEILRTKICSVNIDSWTTNDVYIFYGDQQIFGIDDVTKGILCKDYSDEKWQRVEALEDIVDKYEDELGTYLAKVSGKELAEEDSKRVSNGLHCIGDLERISDHALAIAEIYAKMHKEEMVFSDKAMAELNLYSNAVYEIMSMTCKALNEDDMKIAKRIEPLEEVINGLNATIKKQHIKRLQKGKCTNELGIALENLLNNYERVADHCSNVAASLLQVKTDSFDTHEYLNRVKQESNVEFQAMYSMYKEKYSL